MPNLHEILLTDIIKTGNMIDNKLKKLLINFDLTPSQYNILRRLKGSEGAGLSAGEVKSRMLLPTVDLTRIMDKLVSKKLITRNMCPNHGSRREIAISPKGIMALSAIADLLENYLNNFYTNLLGISDAEIFLNYLEKLRLALNDD